MAQKTRNSQEGNGARDLRGFVSLRRKSGSAPLHKAEITKGHGKLHCPAAVVEAATHGLDGHFAARNFCPRARITAEPHRIDDTECPDREGTMHLRPHIVILAAGVLMGAAGLAQACPRHGAAAASHSVTAAQSPAAPARGALVAWRLRAWRPRAWAPAPS